MTTYTIVSAVNIDSLSAKAGDDTYNINGGYLTVDQDSRYGTNSTTSSIMGNITLSASLGGTIEFNAETVRLIPFDGGASTVPASNTTISGAAGSGKLIGVYSALNVAPTASGAAMPASGYIKIKQWNSGAFVDNEALSGITATVNGTDQVGWIEIVGANTRTATVNRLNTFKVRGAWYDFVGATTTGTRSTTYQIPSNGSAVVYTPGVWVETSVGSGTYEYYPCAGSRTALLANIGTEAARGKFCWISTAGLLRFGHDGTNSTGGYIPPSGLRIRIPNILFSCSTTGAPTVNILPDAAPATRYDFTTTGGGVIDIDKCNMNWYLSVLQAYSVSLTNSSFMTAISLSEVSAPITINNVGIGQEAANTQVGFTMSLCFGGGTVTDLIVTRAALASSGTYVISMADVTGFTFTRLAARTLTYRGNATSGSATITRANSCTFNYPTLIAGRYLLTTCADCAFNDTIYIDDVSSTTRTTVSQYAYVLASSCARCTFDGLSFNDLPMQQPYAGLFNIAAAGCTDIKIRSIGTYDNPLDLGYSGFYNLNWARTTTVATVFQSGHIMKSGDIFYAFISSDTSAITVGSKTVTTTGTTTGYTFTCLNAGATTGSISLYPTMAASVLVLDAGAAAEDVRLQQVYVSHNRGVPYSSDNSSKNILIENLHAAIESAPLHPSLNEETKGLVCTPPLTAQTSVYGNHFVDYCTEELYTGNLGNVPWTRSTTTATVLLPAHFRRTSQLINVYRSSSAAAIITGQKTITVNNANRFTFTCLNAGDATGTLAMSTLSSRLALQMNEKTAETTDLYTLTGSTSFTSAGGLVMTGRGTDSITFTTPDYILGITGFSWAEPVMAGGTLTGYHIYYSIDKNDGVGYSEFKNLSYIRANGGGSNGSTSITMNDSSGVATGDYVWGTNVAPYAYVTGVINSTTIGVDRPNIGTVSSTLRFGSLYRETGINPALGFKQKIRLVSDQTGSTAITSLYYFTETDYSSRSQVYPLDTTDATLSLINLQTGTEVHVYNTATDLELAGSEATAGSTFDYDYTWTGSDYNVYITVLKTGYQWIRYSDQTLGQDGLTIPVFQLLDRNYLNP